MTHSVRQIRRAENAAILAAFLGADDQDIQSLCFLVMLQQARTNAESLKDIMRSIKRLNRQHELQRCLWREIQSVADGKLDSVGDITMEHQMRLQMYMDAFSQVEATLSNLMHKICEAQVAVVANMK